MKLVFDTLDGHSMEFGTDGSKLVRTGVASEIPAAAMSDPLVLLRAFEAVIRRISPVYPGTTNTRITNVKLRPAKGTNQAQFAVQYEGPPQLNKPQSRWVVEDSSTLASEPTELDLEGDVLMAKYTPPGKQDAGFLGPPGAGGIPTYISGMGQSFKPIYHSVSTNVLRPRRQISISGWIIGRPGSVALDTFGCVNDAPMFSLPRGYWLVSHVFAKNENAAQTPFPEQTMVYHVGATFMSRVLYDWSHILIFHDKFGQVPKDLTDDKKKIQERLDTLKSPYSIKQNRKNGFTKVGLYFPKDLPRAFGI